MLRTTLARLLSHKRRVVSTSMAVVLGVAFLAATLILGDTMRVGFGDLIRDGNAGTDVIVRNATVIGGDDQVQRGTLDAAVLEEIAAIEGVDRAAVSIEGIAQVLDADGEPIGGQGPPTFGQNWIDDAELSTFSLVQGRVPMADNEVVLDLSTAERGGLAVGDSTVVRTPQPVDVVIVGLAAFEELDGISGATFTWFTNDMAGRLLLGDSDQITSVLVHAADGVDADLLRDRIAGVLPVGSEALTGAELTAEEQQDLQDDFIGFMEMFLLAFAGIAMVVATFSIHNTFTILVAQRTRESALLRALGASRRQVLGSVVVEALLIGAVASAVGLGVGAGLALGLKALLTTFDLEMAMDGVLVETSSLVIAGAVGVIVTFVASLAPAMKASRVAPLAAMRDVAVDRTRPSAARMIIGVVLSAAGVLVTIIATASAEGAVMRAAGGALLLVIGAVVLGPVVARPIAALLGMPLLAAGQSGRIARRNAMRNPRRTAGSASALMVGTAVVVLFATFGSSIKASLDDTIDRTFAGDLVIVQDSFSGAGIDPQVGAAIASLPEVAASTAIANAVMRVDGVDEFPTAVDPGSLVQVLDLDVQQGDLRSLAPGQLAISERHARSEGLEIGDQLVASFADGGQTTFTIAVVYRVADIFGDVLMTRADWAPHAGRSGDVVVMIDLAEGVTIADGRRAVDAVAQPLAAPAAQDRDEYLQSVAGQIDQFLILVYGLLALAILIALMGIANTLSLSIHERTRELGLLRAVGQTRRQMRASVRWESVIVAVFGTLGGIGLGTFLGWSLVRALSAQEGFGIFAAPVNQLVVIVLLAASAGVLAALRPARRAAKLNILDAIATG